MAGGSGADTLTRRSVANSAPLSPRPVTAVLLFGVVALALLAWWTSRVTVQRQLRAIADCRQRYAEARSAADSGLVDMVYLESYRPQAAGRRASRTCGDLRLAGRLKQGASR